MVKVFVRRVQVTLCVVLPVAALAAFLQLQYGYFGPPSARVRGLSAEVIEKLERQRPETVGQAGRIPGVTPAAVSQLLVWIKRSRSAA